MRKVKANLENKFKLSNYLDVYICQQCNNTCQMCDIEYQCQECEYLEKDKLLSARFVNE